MPGPPELAIEQEQPAIGKFSQYFYHLKTGTGDYTVGYFDLMAELKDSKSGASILDAERMRMLATNKNLKLLSEREFKIEDSEAREWLIKDGDRILRKRYFFSGSGFYQVTLAVSRKVAFRTGKPSSNSSDLTEYYQMIVTRFFGSFKLTPIIATSASTNGTTNGGKKRIISGGVINGKAISLPAPVYPTRAQSAGVHGTVTVRVLINEDGRVIEAKAISGHPMLREEAVKAAYRASFTITKLEGLAVKVEGTINYNF